MSIKNFLQKPLKYTFFNATIGLIILNIGFFFINYLLGGTLIKFFALNAFNFLERKFFWQPLTYMFMHASFSHILINMLVLFIFGIQLEKRMGSWEFLVYYLVTGFLTGILSLFFMGNAVMVGASGAIYAVLLAFATFFPDSTILVFYVLPMRAPIAVLFFAGLSLVMQIMGSFANIAHYAHLAGIILGFLYFIIRFGINPIKIFFPNR